MDETKNITKSAGTAADFCDPDENENDNASITSDATHSKSLDIPESDNVVSEGVRVPERHKLDSESACVQQSEKADLENFGALESEAVNSESFGAVGYETVDSESFGVLGCETVDLESFEDSEKEDSPQPYEHLVVPQDENQNLSIHSLMRMTPLFQGRDVVKIAARHLMATKIKSQKPVTVFFPDHQTDAFEHLVDNNWFDFETYAVLYVCQALSRCNDPYDLYTLVDANKIDKHMQEISECPEWKKVGFALYTTLFPELVKDSETCTPFRAYLNSDRKFWAQAMYEMLRNSKWQYNVIHPVITGQVSSQEYNRDINILFIKLHLLDPTLVMPAFHLLQKALPDLNLEIATTNYLGPPLDCSLIKKEVEAVVYKPMYPRNVPRLSFGEVEVYYGVEVLEFVMMEPRELELLTENIPDNRRTTTLRDRCVVM